MIDDGSGKAGALPPLSPNPSPARGEGGRTIASPLAGEDGARRAAVGRRGVALGRARAMRSEPTEAERVLWRQLRAKRLAGWKWRRQQPIGRYIADFICFEERLIVETDGSQHIGSAYDVRRDQWLRAQGFRLFRFYNADVSARTPAVQEAIVAALIGKASAWPTPFPGPLPQREREQKD